MPECKRCNSPIRWMKEGIKYVSFNPADNTRHVCHTQTTCKYCKKPVIWKDHEGKKHCFEMDGKTSHNDVCTNRDQCAHCGQKIKWTLADNKWVAYDTIMTRELHWNMCPKNPDAARGLVARMVALESENERLKELLKKSESEIQYRDVELRRLTLLKVLVPGQSNG
jgi:hypothetical protein